MPCNVGEVAQFDTVEVAALRDVSLRIEPNEYVAVVGRSGSGKSTLMHILGCLDVPTSGTFDLVGHDVASLDEDHLADVRNLFIGFVFQSFHLLPRLSVLENVLLPRRFLREAAPDIENRAHALLDRIGLGQRKNHRPEQLSGGQMQRVAIARALLMQPALLLADEPTGNLDSRSAADVLGMIDEVHAQGQTVILVTHDHEVAARAQRRVQVRDGKIEHDDAK